MNKQKHKYRNTEILHPRKPKIKNNLDICSAIYTLFVLIFARTNFRAFAQKIDLRAKSSTEFVLKIAVCENKYTRNFLFQKHFYGLLFSFF